MYFEFIILIQSPKSIWGIALGISILSSFSFRAPILGAQEPVLRVLVRDASEIRFRADKNISLLVKGISLRETKVKSLKIKIKDGRLIWSKNNKNEWSILPLNSVINIRSFDPRGIWLGSRRYRGKLDVQPDGERIMVVNHLGIERYLMSVVGSEMPKDWPMPALKAQAVAARTYALKRLGKNGPFDINSTESSQVYLGIESETITTKAAVNSTRSLVIRYKGELISALFHSSSGGKTEPSGSVWKYQLPYLNSVLDYDQHNPKLQWVKVFPPSELRKVFVEIGGLNSIRVLKTSKTGRIIKAKAYGPRGQLLFDGNELRSRLRLKSTLAKFEMQQYETSSLPLSRERLNNGNVKSPFPLPVAPAAYSLLVKGLGAGHGVGMSQWGANGLAKRGANFRQILHHYYSGITIGPY